MYWPEILIGNVEKKREMRTVLERIYIKLEIFLVIEKAFWAAPSSLGVSSP